MRRKRLCLSEPVHERDTGAGLARACRHRDEDVALSFADGPFNRPDGFLLVGMKPAIVKGSLRRSSIDDVVSCSSFARMSSGLNHSGKGTARLVSLRASQNPDRVFCHCLTKPRPFVANKNGTRYLSAL